MPTSSIPEPNARRPVLDSGVADLARVLSAAGRDPFLLYTLLAALFLLAVSLWGGWRRRDFLGVLRPRGLLALTLAVLAGFGLTWLLGDTETALELTVLSRWPLYLVALAYGPSAGLLAALLFAAFATRASLPGLPELVLALELTVLGWFAIAPSPRVHRWAGPLGLLLAYALAWGTGGSAMLHTLTGNGTRWATQWSFHAPLLPGLLASALLLLAVGPGFYRRAFPDSWIIPRSSPATDLPEPSVAPSEAQPDQL